MIWLHHSNSGLSFCSQPSHIITFFEVDSVTVSTLFALSGNFIGGITTSAANKKAHGLSHITDSENIYVNQLIHHLFLYDSCILYSHLKKFLSFCQLYLGLFHAKLISGNGVR